MAVGNWEEAIAWFTKAIQLNPKAIEAYLQRGIAYTKLDNHQQAIQNFDKVLKIEPKNAKAYYDRGKSFLVQQEYQSAEINFNYAIKFDANFAKAYRERGYVRSLQGEQEKAKEDFDRALAINSNDLKTIEYRRKLNSNSLDAESIDRDKAESQITPIQQAQAYLQEGKNRAKQKDYQKAIDCYTKALELHPKLTEAYHQRGIVRHELGEYTEAVEDFDRLLELDPQNREILGAKGMALAKLGKYQKARENYERIEHCNVESLSLQVAPVSHDLASNTDFYSSQFSLVRIDASLYSGLNLVPNQFNNLNSNDLKILNSPNFDIQHNLMEQLIYLYKELDRHDREGSYHEAILLRDEIFKIAEKLFGRKAYLYAVALSKVAFLYHKVNQFDEAEALLKEAIEIHHLDKLYIKNKEYAICVGNLAALYEQKGQFKDAELFSEEALFITISTVGKKGSSYCMQLNNLARLYQTLNRYHEAEKLWLESLEVDRVEFRKNHPSHVIRLSNLAMLYKDMGQYEKGIKSIEEGLKIFSTISHSNKIEWAMLYHNLASLLLLKGDCSKAIYCQALATDIIKALLGKKSLEYTRCLNQQTNYYMLAGRFLEAVNLYQKQLEVHRSCVGSSGLQYEYRITLQNLALALAGANRYREALQKMQEAAKIQTQLIGQVFCISSDNQRIDYLQDEQSDLSGHLSLIHQFFPNDRPAIQSAFDLVMQRKALATEAAILQRTAIWSDRYPHLKSQLQDLQKIDTQIANFSLKTPSSEDKAADDSRLANLQQQRDELDRQLSRQIPELDLQEKLKNADRKAIASALPRHSILIEFVRTPIYDFKAVPARGETRWHPAHYLAFILRAGNPNRIELLDLGEAEPIDTLIRALRRSIRGDRDLDLDDIPENASTPPEIALRQALLEPLEPFLKPQQQIFLAPDGELATLSFGILPSSTPGRYWMEDYHLGYLSVGRDILRFGSTHTNVRPTAPLVIADPDYNLASPHEAASVPSEPWQQELVRDSHGKPIFKPLPATRLEGIQIAKRLGVKPYLGDKALKSLVRTCQSPRILHIATHGYFQETPPQDPQETKTGDLEQAFTTTTNPLLRSGLAFAGANTTLQGKPLPAAAENGLLAAQDAATLNLAATELVVASACKTALGDVFIGEGVMGLRRAFVLAGAQTLVISLWSVPDLATAILMDRFYHNLLIEKLDRAEALVQAQYYIRDLTIAQMRPNWLTEERISHLCQSYPQLENQLRQLSQKSDTDRPYASPRCWGAFICQGNITPLPSIKKQTLKRSGSEESYGIAPNPKPHTTKDK